MAVDKGYAWVVMMANFGTMCVNAGLIMCSGIVITTLQLRFGNDVTKTALAGSLYVALSSLTGPFGAFIISRTSCRITMMTGAALMVVGFLISAYSTSLDLCIVSYGVIAGLGTGICFSVIYIVNGYHFQKKINFATGVSMSGGGVGIFLLPPLLEKAREFYGNPGLFIVAAAVSLQLFVLGALMIPSDLEMEAKTHRKVKVDSNSSHSTEWENYKKLLCDKATLCLIGSYGFFSGGLYTSFMFWPSLCLEHGFTVLQASFFLSISGICALFGRIGVGIVASHSLVSSFCVYCVTCIILGVPCVLFKFYASSMAGQIINAIILGTFNGAPLVIFADVTIQVVGVRYLSTAGGLELSFGGTCNIITPVLCGYIVSVGGTYGDAIIICGISLLIGAVLVAMATIANKRLVHEPDELRQAMKNLDVSC